MVTHRRFELRTIALKVRCSTGWASESFAGVAVFEPTNSRIKIWCLTAWRYPYNAVYLITKTKFLQQIYCTFSTIAKLFCSWPINISTYQKVWYQCGVNSGIRSVWPMFAFPHDTGTHLCTHNNGRSALSRRGSQTIHRIVWFSARSNPINCIEIQTLCNSVRRFASIWGE